MRLPLAAALAAMILAGCGTEGAMSRHEAFSPRDGRAGLQLSGTVQGRQVAVNDGLPRLLVGDCDPPDGFDRDVCIISRTIDGRLVVVSFENPSVLAPGNALPVADPPCGVPERCDDMADVALVDVQLDTGRRVRATGGRLELEVVEEFRRYAGRLTLTLPNGRMSGSFDVVPRPE